MKTHKVLAVFDLDNTLIIGDSDYAWIQYLIAHLASTKNQQEANRLQRHNSAFLKAHSSGTLDMQKWLDFSIGLMKNYSKVDLDNLRLHFMNDILVNMIAPATKKLLDCHRQAGHELIIATATNDYIAQPIATYLNVPYLLATQLEYREQTMTGNTVGLWCFREGKVHRIEEWLKTWNYISEHRYVYSDSQNDIPLLQWADTSVAVDADKVLVAIAQNKRWPIISLRHNHDIQWLHNDDKNRYQDKYIPPLT